MPGVIRAPLALGTLPYTLSIKLSESRAVQMNMNEYHDGSCQRVSLVTGSRRTWKLPKRLDAFHLGLLRAFCNTVQGGAFNFYNPFETLPAFTKNPIGTAGLYLVRFNSDWSQITGMGRSECDLEIIEVSASGAIDIGAPIIPGSGPGDGVVTPPPPFGTGALYISDGILYTGAGQNGSFTFLTDAADVPPWMAGSIFGIELQPTGASPQSGWVGVIHVEYFLDWEIDTPETVDDRLDITYALSLTGTPATGSDTEAIALGTSRQYLLVDESVATFPTMIYPTGKTLYPPIYTSTTPTFQYAVQSGLIGGTVQGVTFGLSVVEISGPETVCVGWPRYHASTRGADYNWFNSLSENLFWLYVVGNLFLGGFDDANPDGMVVSQDPQTYPQFLWPATYIGNGTYNDVRLWGVGGGLDGTFANNWHDGNSRYLTDGVYQNQDPNTEYEVVATQPLTFSSVTLRLFGVDSYFPTAEVPNPAEVNIDGCGCLVQIVLPNGNIRWVKVFDTPVTIPLGGPVSVAMGDTAVTLQIVTWDPKWLNYFATRNIYGGNTSGTPAPYVLISVKLN